MTEAEWNACTDSTPMPQFLRDKASDRKLRLFLVALCRLVWDKIPDDERRVAVETAERYADGGASDEALGDRFRQPRERGRSGQRPSGMKQTVDCVVTSGAVCSCPSCGRADFPYRRSP